MATTSQVQQQLERERAREVEQRLTRENQRVTREKEEALSRENEQKEQVCDYHAAV